MKKDKYIVPKGYKGIGNEIILEFNTQLAVITGLNGCGKSTMLKYLYENYPDRSKCFIKTPQNLNILNNERRIVSTYRGGIRYKDDVAFDTIMEDIESLGLRRGRIDSPFLDKTDFYSSLFDENSINYENGYIYLESIVKLLAEYQFDDLDNIKRSLGVITEKEIEEYLIWELNQTKDDNQTNFGVKNGKSIVQKHQNDELSDEQSKKLNLKKKKIEEKLKIELRTKSKINSEQSLKRYIYMN